MKYTKQQIKDAVNKSKCYKDIFKNLKIKINGGSYNWIKNLIKRYEISTDHFYTKEQILKKALEAQIQKRQIDYTNIQDLSNGDRIKSKKLKSFLLAHDKEYECNKCKLKKWNGNDIVLDIDHIDGNCYNNHIENLQFLCPNCHRQKTIPTIKNKKSNKKTKSKIKKPYKENLKTRKFNPTKQELEKLFKNKKDVKRGRSNLQCFRKCYKKKM